MTFIQERVNKYILSFFIVAVLYSNFISLATNRSDRIPDKFYKLGKLNKIL